MAKKGQKFNKYSIELKNEILQYYKNNNCSLGDLSRKFNVSKQTIKNWVYVPEKSLSFIKRGRPKNNGEIDYRARYEILKKFQAFLKEQHEKK